MCGICGVFGHGDGETVRAMLSTLGHRGPDDAHQVGGDDFVLGARRLSIVDIESGRQPVSNEEGTVWAAQNGELYNHSLLRSDLLTRGHSLRTRCDTEVLPHLYEEYGMALAEHIDGMFAVAIWDDVRKIGLLARDRMGKKPLYYFLIGNALYFSSELKALLRVPGFERRLNLVAMHHYLSYKHVPHPLSIFEGVFMLPPAHCLVFTPGTEPQIRQYWSLSFSEHPEFNDWSEEETVDRLLELLKRGVERRLMSDVPVGFFLSGGIDSSLSTAIAAEMSSAPLKTFTLTYASGSTNSGKEEDRRWARWVAKRYGTQHHEEVVEFGNFPDRIREILTAFDEPFAGVVSTYFLSGLIAKHVKVAVAGDGADELFGSYRSHRLAGPLANLDEYERTKDTSLLKPFDNDLTYLKELKEVEDWKWRAKLFVLTDEEKSALYRTDVAETLVQHMTESDLCEKFENLTARDPLNRILEAEFKGIFPDQVLTFVDRLSMAHSLEVRSAYLDTDVVSFAAGLPGRLKINGGETKYILKKVAERYFPSEMVYRPKEGFMMPVTEWVLGELEGYVRDTLSPRQLDRHGLFDNLNVGKLIDRLYERGGDYNDVNKVMALVVFQEWHDLYMTP